MKLKLAHILSILTLCLLFVSCKKDKLPTIAESNNPIFKVSGTIDGNTVEIVAGDNHAGMTNSITQTNGVRFYKGTLGNSINSFNLLISDGDLDKSEHLDYINKPVNLYQESEEILFTCSKESFANKSRISLIKWYINDEFYGYNKIEIFKPGVYNICAEVRFYDNSSEVICNDVILGYKKNSIGELKHTITNEGKLNAWVDSEDEIISREWYINDSLVDTGIQLSSLITEDHVSVKVDMRFKNGVHRSKEVLVDNTSSGKFVQDFTLAENSSDLENDFSSIYLYTINGIEYTSLCEQNLDQNLSYTFSEYSENGISVNTVNGSIKCNLLRLSDNIVVEADLIFNLALPKSY